MPPTQPTQVRLPVRLKAMLICLLPVLGLLLACERDKDTPAPTGPLVKAIVDGVPWETTEAVFMRHPITGLPALYGSVAKGTVVQSGIILILLDQLRVGDYPNQVLASYYEDDFSQSWSMNTQYEYALRITRYEKNRVWGHFRFTASELESNTAGQPPVREIARGSFENIPVVGIAGTR